MVPVVQQQQQACVVKLFVDSCGDGDDVETLGSHKSNRVSTTKYSILMFVPRNLWEQFQRLANIWFLFISLLQLLT
eukprot:GSA25T00005004001.1